MSLKVAEISAFRAGDTPYKKADAKGLYLEIFPNGSKLWRWKYRVAGKEKRLALGAWPDVTLAKARQLCEAARATLADGADPGLERKRAKATARISAANTFASVAAEYIEGKMVGEGRAETTLAKARWFLDLLRPAVGELPISDVDPQMLLAPLKRLEARGNKETAKKVRSFASRVFRYGVATGRCKADPAALLQGALVAPKARHYAAILEPAKLGELLRAVDAYTGNPTTRLALQITPHVFVRPGELRHAEWSEFDLDGAIWRIPAGKMKARRAHSVPLSLQVVALLGELRALTGGDGYVFPALYSPRRPMSENTINVALRRMGFGKDEATAHGFRATASTLLNESGKWQSDAIERALAHGDSDAVRGTYSRGQYWEERVRMATWWSDYLDRLRVGGEVIPFGHVESNKR
ncbi:MULTISPECIES: tyrosine-type recombinase/integrase [unclassified Sphingopyxis]|uniref:tyrosine-type recombinase/integrase n=1 Tax=unclassified Sphingopyxis TaxID=2614943 RepID=UPI0025D15F26|nr:MULTISPECIES: integrase arm-type DNA-binding domain-containing protein [unclassified Sphingopyxis]